MIGEGGELREPLLCVRGGFGITERRTEGPVVTAMGRTTLTAGSTGEYFSPMPHIALQMFSHSPIGSGSDTWLFGGASRSSLRVSRPEEPEDDDEDDEEMEEILEEELGRERWRRKLRPKTMAND